MEQNERPFAWSDNLEEPRGEGNQGYKNQHKEPESPKKPKNHSFLKCMVLIVVSAGVAGTAFYGAVRGIQALEPQKVVSTTRLEQPVKQEAGLNWAVESTETGKMDEQIVDGGITDVSGIAENVMPAIVAITNMSEVEYRGWFGMTESYESESAGSGIIISQDGDSIYIATNNHVVENAKTLTVQFSDDSTATGEIKGTDPGSDLAVVQVKLADIDKDARKTIRVALLGDSSLLSVGEPAIAIGNALGYGQSVTTGVISAIGRAVEVEDESGGEAVVSDLVQTDAAINPGNSGGALLNLRGEVIGINSVKYSDVSVEGIGYAIPMNTAAPIIRKLITRELAAPNEAAYFGVSGVDVSGDVASTYNMPEGVYVYQVVKGSPAEEAGIAEGDIITEFDGTKVTSKTEIEDLMQYCSAGSVIQVKVLRLSNENNGSYEEKNIEVVLAKKR